MPGWTLGSVQRSSRPISANVRAQKGSGRGPTPQELAPSQPALPARLPARPLAGSPGTLPRGDTLSNVIDSLHSLAACCSTTLHPSSQLAFSFSRITMGRSPLEIAEQQGWYRLWPTLTRQLSHPPAPFAQLTDKD